MNQGYPLWALLFLGMLVTYLAQIINLVRVRTSQGLSCPYLVLRTLGRVSALCSTVMVQAEAIRCCRDEVKRELVLTIQNVVECIPKLLPVHFMLLQFVLVCIM